MPLTRLTRRKDRARKKRLERTLKNATILNDSHENTDTSLDSESRTHHIDSHENTDTSLDSETISSTPQIDLE